MQRKLIIEEFLSAGTVAKFIIKSHCCPVKIQFRKNMWNISSKCLPLPRF
jgi:hypothetical protein